MNPSQKTISSFERAYPLIERQWTIHIHRKEKKKHVRLVIKWNLKINLSRAHSAALSAAMCIFITSTFGISRLCRIHLSSSFTLLFTRISYTPCFASSIVLCKDRRCFSKDFPALPCFPPVPLLFPPSFFFLPDATRRRRWDCMVSGRGSVGREHRVGEDQTNAEEVDEKKEIKGGGRKREMGGKDGSFELMRAPGELLWFAKAFPGLPSSM